MQKVNALIAGIIELDSYADACDVKAYDEKMQAISKQIGEMNAGLKENVDKILGARKLNWIKDTWELIDLDQPSKDHFQETQTDILKVIDKAMPDLKILQKVQKHKAIRDGLFEALRMGKFDKLEQAFKKEGEVDLNTLIEMPDRRDILQLSYLNYTTTFSQNRGAGERSDIENAERQVKVLKLLLQQGAQITDENKINIISFLIWSVYNCKLKSVDSELIQLLVAQGLDLNTPFIDLIRNEHIVINSFVDRPDLMQTAIFYGSNSSKIAAFHWDELVAIRDDLVKKLFPNRTHQSLSFKEKNLVFQQAQERYQFRLEWRKGGEPGKKSETYLGHEKFYKAIQARNFPEAEKLLERIDINAPLSYREPYGHIPMLSAAVLDGDLELMKFLLEAGANPNIYFHNKGAEEEWLPPIIMAAIYDIPNKEQVIELLKNANADINARDNFGMPVIKTAFNILSERENFNPLPALENCIKAGFDPKIHLWDVLSLSEYADEFRRATIFYGGGLRAFYPDLEKLRAEALVELNQDIRKKQGEEIMKVDAAKGLSEDLVKLIGKLHEKTLEELTPEERLDLFKLCQKKYKETQS